MALRRYHDFVILTDEPADEPGDRMAPFTVRVFQSPAGEGEKKDTVTIENYEYLKSRSDLLAKRLLDLDEQIAYGRQLAALLLPPYARKLFHLSLGELGPGEGLRIRLRLLRRLAYLPWEYMHLGEEGERPVASKFIALDPRISIVRHEAIATPPEEIPPGDVRRILIAMATPEPHEIYEPLSSLPAEQQQIRAALSKVPGLEVRCLPNYGGALEWETIPGARPDEIQSTLQDLQRVDLFHFSGHGDFSWEMAPEFREYEGTGFIVLADENNRGVEISADELQVLLGERGIRLVTLGACETGTRDIYNAWSSIPAALLRGRIPSVVAMQFGVSDDLAAAFMAAVYQGLVAGSTIDEAVFSGRAAMRALSYGKDADARDWGTPVLYSRVPGGCLFPPVADKEARRQAEQGLDARSSLHQAWWDWTDHQATVGVRQLRYLAKLGESLEVQPAQALLLLRSAVEENEVVECWLAHLRRGGAGLMAELDEPTSSPEAGAAAAAVVREEASVFDLARALQADRPQGVGPVAWAAARDPDGAVRHTAAFALTALSPVPQAGLERIDGALGHIKPWERFARRAELRGALADGDPGIERANAGLPPWDRLGIWFWRFWRRAFDDRDRILALTLGAAVGAALGLGLFRALVAVPAHQPPGLYFAWYSTIALLLGGALGLALALAPPFMLIPRKSRAAAAPLGVILGTLFFAVTHLLVMLLFKVGGAETYRLGTGAVAGFGLALAIYGLGRRPWRRGAGCWLLRGGVAGIGLALAQFLALSSAAGWQDRKFRGAVEFAVEPNFYVNFFSHYRWYQPLDSWVQSHGGFFAADLLAFLDAALVGVVLACGMVLGLAGALRLLDRYRALIGRMDE